MAKLFVSYSRKDSVAARRLIEAFKSQIGQDVWVDWESIPPAVDWLEQIFRGIEEADAFIFMVSPDSIKSDVCNVEIGRAALNNKRIIPIVLRDVNPKDTNPIISKLNWTFIRETDNFDEGLAKVKTAIELDLDWLEEHRRLQVRALEWHRKKDVSLLLRGRDLRNARHMLETYTAKDPIPTDLQTKYIEHSEKTERNRTFAWIATGVALIALAILAYTAFQQSLIAKEQAGIADQNAAEAKRQAQIADQNAILANQNAELAQAAQKQAEDEREKAIEQEKLAKAQRSAARAQIYQTRTGELYTSTLFALDSLAESPTTPSEEAQEILRQNISLLPLPIAQANQDGSMMSFEINPNGQTFLAVSDQTVCVRNLQDGTEVFCATSSSITDAIFLQGGKFIASGDEDGTVSILDAASGNIERTISNDSPVRDLDTDSLGNKLTIACRNGKITIFDLRKSNDKGYPLQTFGTLAVADLSNDGSWFAAGSESGEVTVWNLSSSNKPVTSGSHRDAITSIRFTKDHRFVISGGVDGYAVGFDTQTSKEAFRFPHADWVDDISVPAGNLWLTTASADSRVRVWDVSTGKERLVMPQDGAVNRVRISPDEKWIASTGDDRTVRVWSTYTGVEMLQIPLDASGTALAFNGETSRLITGDENGSIHIWDVSGLVAPAKYIKFNDLTWIAKFTPARKGLIASSANQIWSLDPEALATPYSFAPGAPYQFKNDIYDLVVSPTGETIGFSTYANEYVIFDLKSKTSRYVEPSGDAYALAFSSDGSRFITGTTQGTIETWDVTTGQQINSFEEGDSILSIATGPNGIALGVEDKIIVLDANAGQKLTEWDAPGKNQLMAFNSDGSILASGNTSGQIEIWKMQSDQKYSLQTTLTREQPYSIAFDPTGGLLAVGTTNQVYLIDAAAGVEIARIPHKGIVYSVSISSDGKTLATASLKTIQLWEIARLETLKVDELQETACSRLLRNFSKSEWSVLFGSQEDYKQLCPNLPSLD